jgi:hypothetical protein
MQYCACASSIIIGKLNIFGLLKAIISIHSIIEIHLSIMPNTRKYFNLNLNWQKLYLAVKYGRTVCRLLDSHLENTARCGIQYVPQIEFTSGKKNFDFT